MKKLFFTLCALCLCGTMWATPTNSTYWADDSRPTNESGGIYQDETSGLYFYVNSSGNAVITYINDSYDTTSSTSLDNSSWTSGYETSNLTSLVIPEYVSDGTNQYPVTVIGRLAFFKATNFQGSLTVPSYITELGSNAFENCTNITEVTIEYSETALKDDANQLYGSSFWNCSNIATVNLNRNVTAGRETTNYLVTPFNQLTGITTLYVGEHVTSIPIYMFYKCSNLATVYCYAGSVPTLGADVFTSIADNATLHVCKSLLNDYEGSAWATYFSTIINDLDDPGLEEGTYQDVTTGLYFEINEDETTASIYHDELGVYDNDNLVAHATITGAYTLPATVKAEEGGTEYAVTRVEKEAFLGAGITGHLVIPANILYMGESAFENCTGLTEVTYEYSSTSLQEENTQHSSGAGCSFRGCSGVTTVNLYRTVEWTNINHLDGPFCYQTGVTTVNVGPHVTQIGGYAFHNGSNATGISNINVYSVEPCTLGQYTFDLSDGAHINLPNGALEIYQNASASSNRDPWSNYSAYFAELDNAFAITTHENDEGTAYATFYNSAANVELFNLDGDTELTAYEATTLETEDDGLIIDIAELGNVVPASTGVIVETAAEGTYLAIATENEATSASSNNHLYGYDSAQTIETPSGSYYYYLLSSNNGEVGFYWGATGGAAFECQAHKAYLALAQDDVKNADQISIRKGSGDDTTGISSVESATEGATVKGIYTIQGVRVSNMNQKGVYIVDGKKVLVK